ncbi:MAG: HNH endonuclease signature motif containing protein [Pseudomonadota bacterium]
MGRLSAMPPRLAPLGRRVGFLPKVAEQFYSSPEWRALKLARSCKAKCNRGPSCRNPDWHDAKARAKPSESLVLDHIKERRDGGADLDPANTQWLTFSEHQAKTARARKERAHGRT